MAQPPDTVLLTLPHRRRESRWIQRILLFAIVVLLVDALFGERGLRETLLASDRYTDAVRELNAVRAENTALKHEALRLTRDPRAIETEARRHLGLLRPGEILFIVKTR
jgi:cell division protein FtsB